MDSAAASAGPWLVLGAVLGLLLAGVAVLAVRWVRRTVPAKAAPAEDAAAQAGQESVDGWADDDLPGFLDRPPGIPPEDAAPGTTVATPIPAVPAPAGTSVPFAEPAQPAPAVRRTVPAHAAPTSAGPEAGRLLLVLVTAAVLLVGVAAALAALTERRPTAAAIATAPAEPMRSADAPPAWDVPALTAPPERPEPGDPGAGHLSTVSVPIDPQGAFARLSFEGLVLQRRAVGITAAYPGISVTAVDVGKGPALAHVRLPVWNCLTDTAPADPVAAGCRRLPTEYADLPSPALTLTEDGEGLRISGRFPTYLRPNGTPPEWTGRVYPFTVHVAPTGGSATGSLHLGAVRVDAVDDPRLSGFRRGS